MVIKKANYLVPFFTSLMLNLAAWRKQTSMLWELNCQSAAVEVLPHKGQADQRFTPLHHRY